jgi:hypothetical protein
MYPSFTYIANRCTDTRDSIDGRSVQASEVVRQGVRDIEGLPVSLSRRTIDEQHDAKRDRVRDGEADTNPDSNEPALGICTIEQSSVEEENGHFGATAADQERELTQPHAEHCILACLGLDIPDMAISLSSLRVHHRDGREHQSCKPSREQNCLPSRQRRFSTWLMQHLTSSNPSLPACPLARSQYRMATMIVAAANQMDE